jgi:hypothetical protein
MEHVRLNKLDVLVLSVNMGGCICVGRVGVRNAASKRLDLFHSQMMRRESGGRSLKVYARQEKESQKLQEFKVIWKKAAVPSSGRSIKFWLYALSRASGNAILSSILLPNRCTTEPDCHMLITEDATSRTPSQSS